MIEYEVECSVVDVLPFILSIPQEVIKSAFANKVLTMSMMSE